MGLIPIVVALTRYFAPGVVFFNANTNLEKSGALTGVVDGKKGIVSIWVKFTGTDGDLNGLFAIASGASNRFYIRRGDEISILGFNSAGAQIFNIRSSNHIVAADGWVNILSSWDLGASVAHLYIDDVNRLVTNTLLNQAIDYLPPSPFAYVGVTASSARLKGETSDFYVNFAEYMDLSVEANRRKFISAGGKPVNLGPTGSVPTTNAPAVFLHGTASSYNTNLGTGGNFTVDGDPLTNAATSPSD